MAPPKTNTRSNSSNQDQMSVEEKLDLLLTDVGQIKNDNKQYLKDIKEIKDDLKTFKLDISKSVESCFEQLNAVEKSVTDNSNLISSCQGNVDSIVNENTILKRQVCDLQGKLAAAEQYSRSNCLEIQGVPEDAKENIIFVVKRVAAVLNFKLEESMIDAVHRLSVNPNKPNSPRGIIIKFCRRLDMEQMRQKARVKKVFSATEMGFQSDSKIYVNLSLSRDTRVLWALVQEFKNKNNYKFSWITNAGKIFLRKKEGQRAIHITNKSDLVNLK